MKSYDFKKEITHLPELKWRVEYKLLLMLFMLFLLACQSESEETQDILQNLNITTSTVTNITMFTATTGGLITSNDEINIIRRGVVFGINPAPTLADNSTNDGSGAGAWQSNLSGLIEGTPYFIRAYAITNIDTIYGNERGFTTINGASFNDALNPELVYGSVADIEGNIYSTIVIQSEEWMAENLRTSLYSNGDEIPNVIEQSNWNNQTNGAWCYYENDNNYNYPYGKLYNWYTVSDQRNVCPVGWHIPTESEWWSLISYLDPTVNGESNSNYAGGKMKSSGTQYWAEPNSGASNESGFSAVPGGIRNSSMGFNPIGNRGYWWCGTELDFNPALAVSFSLNTNSITAEEGMGLKFQGLSVRCKRDE